MNYFRNKNIKMVDGYNMTTAEWYSTLFQFIDLILSLMAFIGSVIAIYFTYQNLKEMKKQLAEQKEQYFEQNRGSLIFYISKSSTSIFHSLIIKNFGNSSAKLLSLKITPDLDWAKTRESNLNKFNVSNLKNIFLAPQQHISSEFDFRSYPEKKFDIEICYETCGKILSEQYSIDIDFIGNLITAELNIKDELSALKNINKSITALSDKFI